MALVTDVKEFLYNLFNQNFSSIGAYTVNAVLPQITESTLEGEILQSATNQYFLTSSTPNIIYDLGECLVYFNWYDKKEFLNSYVSNDIYLEPPSNSNLLNKNDLLDDTTDDIICYLGTTDINGSNVTYNKIFSVFHRNEITDIYEQKDGLRFQKLTYNNKNYLVGCPHVCGFSFGYYLTEPLFYGQFYASDISNVLSIYTNSARLNFYDAVNSDLTTSNRKEKNYFIVDDLDNTKYHWFRTYNKNQLFSMFKLWGFSLYYKTIEDLEAQINQYDFNDTGESEPTTDTEPNIQTNPGQAQNSVQNQQNGTGDWSSTEVTAPDTPYTGTGIGNCLYTINLKQMYKVRNELFRPDIISSFFIDNESLLGCTIWPFKYSGNGLYTVTEVIIGKYHVQLMGDSNITPYAYAVLPTYIPKVYVAQGITIQPKNGNFLDYAPYTKLKFYLPYIGIVDVDPCDIYDHTIDIYYLYEPTTGKGKGCIKSSSGVTYSWDCMLGTTVPFTISNMNQLMQNLALAGIKAAGVYATGGLGAIGEAYSATEVISSIAGSVRDFKISSTGSTGDSMGRLEPQEVYCITVGPYTRIPDDYAKNYGRPSLITVTLNKLRGFTTVPNPLFTTTATDTEKAEIVALLQGGVIINGQTE